MAVKHYKPTSAGRRNMTGHSFAEITRKKPHKPLTRALRRKAGRNNSGRITVRHRGGGHKRRYRVLDFRREKSDCRATVVSIEYDPNRSARIALLEYEDGEKRYILAAQGLAVGDTVGNGKMALLRPGNALPLSEIPLGTQVHCIELQPGRGGQMARSAGAWAQLLAREGGRATLRLPSGEMRYVSVRCAATIGQVGNPDHGNIKLGKAGRKRWLGRRPTVRGTAQDPASHPHGGGEGRSGIGLPGPKTPWGKPALGKRTRRNKRTDRFIIRRRGRRR